jgi:cell division protease FtsH
MQQDQRRVTFADVAGIEEAKQELEEIVEFLKDPQKFQRLGGRIPKGCLLIGPPGTGKTLLARAIAGEANVPFFTISGSDFVEMFVGVGASRVRDMFEQAKRNAPCIVFIDEIDAVGRHRGTGLGGGHDEREQTLNQLLVEMDGFEANEGVILIAATNRPDVLDPALLRPGRFDRQVVVPNPDILGREQILKVHMRKVQLSPDVDARVIARGTPGFSGADLANLVNEAALIAARAGKRLVGMIDFEAAKDKVLMGAERRSMVMTEQEKQLTAYHEAGHALVGLLVPGNDPLHKVTIIPRGRALGVTMNLPERDRYAFRKNEIEARLAMMFGGRVAEQLIFGEENVTTGASNDIQQATDMARRMVTEWGMSEQLGRLRYSDNEEEIFLGRSITRSHNVSEDTARIIDAEVRRIVERAEGKARVTLTEHLDDLHKIAAALLEFETLSGDDVQRVLRGEPIDRPDASDPGTHDRPSPRKVSVPVGGQGSRRPGSGSVPGLHGA